MSALAGTPNSLPSLVRHGANHLTSPSKFCIQPLLDNAVPRDTCLASPSPSPSKLQITAMANPRRVKMVAQQIRREVSEMLLFDKTIRDAITPEHALGADRYLSSVATISEVEVSGDLQVAKVYVSVYGDERGQEQAMAGLKSVTGYIRHGLGKKMRLRFTPEVRFIQDEAMERGTRVLSILSQLEREREAKDAGKPMPRAPLLARNDLDNDEDDDFFGDFENFDSTENSRRSTNEDKKPE